MMATISTATPDKQIIIYYFVKINIITCRNDIMTTFVPSEIADPRSFFTNGPPGIGQAPPEGKRFVTGRKI